MEAEGRVLRVCGDHAMVQIIRKGACGDNCAHCGGCGAETMEVKALCTFNVHVGDWVKISSRSGTVYFGLFILFILPLILPLIAYFIAAGSGLEVYAAVFGFLISLVLIRLLSRSTQFQKQSIPQIIEVILKARNKNE